MKFIFPVFQKRKWANLFWKSRKLFLVKRNQKILFEILGKTFFVKRIMQNLFAKSGFS